MINIKGLNNLSIGKRLVILVCFALVVIISTVCIGMTNNQRLATEIDLGYEAITRPLAAVANARGHFNAMRTTLYDLAHDFNSKEQNRLFKAHVMECLSEYERSITLYQEIVDEYGTGDPYEAEAVAYLYRQLAPLRVQVEQITAVAERTGYGADAVRMLRGDFLAVAEDISTDLANLTEILEAQTQYANTTASILNKRNNHLSLLIVAAAAVILLFIAYIIVNSIMQPLKEMTSAATSLSDGQLDISMEYRSTNQLGILADSLRLLAQSMKDKLSAEQNARESDIAKERADAAREAVISSLEYASKIQRNLLPSEHVFKEAFADYSNIWKPKDIVGGDIYWIKNFSEGTVLCVCDCTGHGTPGALLTMLVVSTFESCLNEQNYKDTANTIWELEKRLVAVLNVDAGKEQERGLTFNDGCDLAVLYIARDGEVSVSAGNTPVFICDGSNVNRIRGQRLHVGDGAIKHKEKIKVVTIPANPNNKFYIPSDGLYEQVGGEKNIPFGYDILKKTILENHQETQSVISERIWQAFENYRGNQRRRDDFELITFQPRIPQEM